MKRTNSNFYEKFHKDVRLQKRIIDNNNFTYKGILEVLRKFIPELKGKKVLDVGCGVGTIDFYLAKLNLEVLGIDLSEKAVEMCVLNANLLDPKGKIRFRSGNFLKESFGNKFDLIICSEVIEHVKEENYFITKIRGLLKEEGLLIITAPSSNSLLSRLGFLNNVDKRVGHIRRYTLDDLRSKFVKNNFVILDERKVDGLLRNLLFSFKTFGFINRVANRFSYISRAISFFDKLLIPLSGESDLILVAKIKEK